MSHHHDGTRHDHDLGHLMHAHPDGPAGVSRQPCGSHGGQGRTCYLALGHRGAHESPGGHRWITHPQLPVRIP